MMHKSIIVICNLHFSTAHLNAVRNFKKALIITACVYLLLDFSYTPMSVLPHFVVT